MNTENITGFACCLLIVGMILAILNVAVAWWLDDLLQEIYEIDHENLMDTAWTTTERDWKRDDLP
jgi:hypothetical protein